MRMLKHQHVTTVPLRNEFHRNCTHIVTSIGDCEIAHITVGRTVYCVFGLPYLASLDSMTGDPNLVEGVNFLGIDCIHVFRPVLCGAVPFYAMVPFSGEALD
jgi:hypothetical protein